MIRQWLALVLVAVLGCGGSETTSSQPASGLADVAAPSGTLEARVNMGLSSDAQLTYVMTNEDEIRQLIVLPLTNAKADESPGKYELFGTIEVKYQDGRRLSYYAFLPFGYVKTENKYFLADLSALRERLRKELRAHGGALSSRP